MLATGDQTEGFDCRVIVSLGVARRLLRSANRGARRGGNPGARRHQYRSRGRRSVARNDSSLFSQRLPRLRPGDRCLVHAAAGGTGRLLVQMAKLRGAEVVATVGSDAKVELARSAGADHV